MSTQMFAPTTFFQGFYGMDTDELATKHGEFLNERRLDLGLRWSEVANDMLRLHGESVTPDYLSKIKRGAAPLARMSVDAREALRKVLRISAEDWERVTGLYSPASEIIKRSEPPEAFDVKQPGYHPEPILQARVIPHWGSVGAGLNPEAYAQPHHTMRRFPNIPALEGYRDEDLFTLDVVGDSMACAEVQNEIREGSIAIFHCRLEPQPGDIVAVWLEQEQTGVLKLLTHENGHVVLYSYNDHHKPIILSPDDRDYVQGVYITHIPPGRRARSSKFRK